VLPSAALRLSGGRVAQLGDAERSGPAVLRLVEERRLVRNVHATRWKEAHDKAVTSRRGTGWRKAAGSCSGADFVPDGRVGGGPAPPNAPRPRLGGGTRMVPGSKTGQPNLLRPLQRSDPCAWSRIQSAKQEGGPVARHRQDSPPEESPAGSRSCR